MYWAAPPTVWLYGWLPFYFSNLPQQPARLLAQVALFFEYLKQIFTSSFDIISGLAWILRKSILRFDAHTRRRQHSCMETLWNLHTFEIKTSSVHDGLTASTHDLCSSCGCYILLAHTHAHRTVSGLIRVVCTSLEGLRRTSPTPPPLLKPWLNTVTMHISRESHVRSMSPSSSPLSRKSDKAERKALISLFKTLKSTIYLSLAGVYFFTDLHKQFMYSVYLNHCGSKESNLL